MGMYNEVSCSCPKCNGPSIAQVSQYTLGFGNFNLEDKEDLAERLTEEEISSLFEEIKDADFECRNLACQNVFRFQSKKNRDKKLRLIDELMDKL